MRSSTVLPAGLAPATLAYGSEQSPTEPDVAAIPRRPRHRWQRPRTPGPRGPRTPSVTCLESLPESRPTRPDSRSSMASGELISPKAASAKGPSGASRGTTRRRILGSVTHPRYSCSAPTGWARLGASCTSRGESRQVWAYDPVARRLIQRADMPRVHGRRGHRRHPRQALRAASTIPAPTSGAPSPHRPGATLRSFAS
jgi:hypothetical protein